MKAEINFSFMKSEERGGEKKIISGPSFFYAEISLKCPFCVVGIHKIITCLSKEAIFFF